MSGFNNASCSDPPVTVAEIIRVMDDFERQFPKRDRCDLIEMHPTTFHYLSEKLHVSGYAEANFQPTLYGLSVRERYDIPPGSWAAVMANGDLVLHYLHGRIVRCTKEPA